MLARATSQREGKTLHENSVQVFHIKDGKVTEQWLHPGTPTPTQTTSSGADSSGHVAQRAKIVSPLEH